MQLVDQTNHPVVINEGPLRIVSLVPSQTELLYYFGLDLETVGITKFCIHPKKWHQSKQRVGGTKTCNLDKVRELKPDLIIANKEENSKEDVDILRREFQVYTSDIITIHDAFEMIKDIGVLTKKEAKSKSLVKEIVSNFSGLPKLNGSVIYLIWKDPYMSVGTQTFINSILKEIGLKNAHTINLRYDEINTSEISQINPNYIFLSSEPYPFKEKHISDLKKKSDAKVVLVDGEMFSWYGSRLLEFNDYYLNTLLPQLK